MIDRKVTDLMQGKVEVLDINTVDNGLRIIWSKSVGKWIVYEKAENIINILGEFHKEFEAIQFCVALVKAAKNTKEITDGV